MVWYNDVPKTQLFVDGGSATFYTAQFTYPSGEYYELKVLSLPGSPGIIFVPHPNTSNAEVLVYCSFKGSNFTETNVSFVLKPGSMITFEHLPTRFMIFMI